MMLFQNSRKKVFMSGKKKGGGASRTDFVTRLLEVFGERGGEIFGSKIGNLLSGSMIVSIAGVLGTVGIDPETVLNALPYLGKLPISKDLFADTAEGALRGFAEHLRPLLKVMPAEESAQKLWLSKEFDSFKSEAKKKAVKSSAEPLRRNLFEVVAGLKPGLRDQMDQIMIKLPAHGWSDTFTRGKATTEGRRRAFSEELVVDMLETRDPVYRVMKLETMVYAAPLLNPPKTGIAAFLENLEKQVMAEAEGLKPDGKHMKKFQADAKASADASRHVVNRVNHLLGSNKSKLPKL